MLDCIVNIPFGISSIVSYSQPHVAMWNLSLEYSYLKNGFFFTLLGTLVNDNW